MKKVKIQLNELFASDRATTQEDNHAQIVNIWHLFNQNEEMNEYRVGRMVKYVNGNYALTVGGLRFDLKANEVTFN